MYTTSFQSQSNTTLAAVALQDHMSRVLSLQDPFKKKKINHGLPVVARKSDVKTKQRQTQARKSQNAEGNEFVLDPRPQPLTLGMSC